MQLKCVHTHKHRRNEKPVNAAHADSKLIPF